MKRSLFLSAALALGGATSFEAQSAPEQAKPAPNPGLVPPPNPSARPNAAVGAAAQHPEGTNLNPALPGSRLHQEALPQVGVPASSFTAEQRAKLQEASKKLQTAQTPHYQRLSQIRREIEELGKQENVDENAIREKAKEIGTIEGELAILRSHHYKELREALPKEQFEMLQQGGAPRPAVQQRLNAIVERTNVLSTNRPAAPPITRPAATPTPPKR